MWIVAGAVRLRAHLAAARLAGAPPRLTWSLLLMLAVLAARVVPGLVVDVPDQYLIDLERLAVTAWSARERPGGKRGRAVVPASAASVVAGHGTRMLTAATAAIAVVVLVSAPLLLATATLRVDRIGARCLVGFAGAALLLAARSYRHRGAGALLRTAGLGCWLALLVAARARCWATTADPGRRDRRDRPRGRAGPRGRRHRSGLALGLVVAPCRGGRGTVRCARRRIGRGRRPDGSASCGNWRACGNSGREV